MSSLAVVVNGHLCASYSMKNVSHSKITDIFYCSTFIFHLGHYLSPGWRSTLSIFSREQLCSTRLNRLQARYFLTQNLKPQKVTAAAVWPKQLKTATVLFRSTTAKCQRCSHSRPMVTVQEAGRLKTQTSGAAQLWLAEDAPLTAPVSWPQPQQGVSSRAGTGTHNS